MTFPCSTTQPQPLAGPSIIRKPSAALPGALQPQAQTQRLLQNKRKRKLPPPLPNPPAVSSHPSASTHPRRVAPTLPLKTAQGVSKIRSESAKDGFGREVVFVTRKTGLGALMGRCRSLVVDEGYTSLRFHAIGAAIPQALLLIHALIDLLPYPVGEKGMWYEIRTGSVECVDEVETIASGSSTSTTGKGLGKGKGQTEEEEDEDLSWLEGLGNVEQNKPERISRIKSTIQIDLHISPRPKSKTKAISTSTLSSVQSASASASAPIPKPSSNSNAQTMVGSNTTLREKKSRNRPSKKKRVQLAEKRLSVRREEEDAAAALEREARADEGGEMDEEEMMNLVFEGGDGDENDDQEEVMDVDVDEDEEEEEIEQVERR